MNLRDAFAGISEAREEKPRPDKVGTKSVKQGGVSGKKRIEQRSGGELESPRAALPLQGTAKSRHPEFEAVKIYVRRETRKRAWRKWEDAQGGDFSDLVEKLLEEYLGR